MKHQELHMGWCQEMLPKDASIYYLESSFDWFMLCFFTSSLLPSSCLYNFSAPLPFSVLGSLLQFFCGINSTGRQVSTYSQWTTRKLRLPVLQGKTDLKTVRIFVSDYLGSSLLSYFAAILISTSACNQVSHSLYVHPWGVGCGNGKQTPSHSHRWHGFCFENPYWNHKRVGPLKDK